MVATLPLILLGGGGHALVVAEAAQTFGTPIAGFFDDHPAAASAPLATRLGIPHLGPLQALASSGALSQQPAILCVGGIAARRTLLDLLRPAHPTTVRHCTCVVSPSAVVGRGVFIGPLAVVHTCATLADHTIINTSAVVEHECSIGPNTHIAPGAVLCGNVRVGSDTLVGAGARVLPGRSIGNGCTIGAGAVIIRDVPDGSTVVGSPGRFV